MRVLESRNIFLEAQEYIPGPGVYSWSFRSILLGSQEYIPGVPGVYSWDSRNVLLGSLGCAPGSLVLPLDPGIRMQNPLTGFEIESARFRNGSGSRFGHESIGRDPEPETKADCSNPALLTGFEIESARF